MRKVFLIPLLLLQLVSRTQELPGDDGLVKSLQSVQDAVTLFDGKLKMVNVYKQQMLVIAQYHQEPEAVLRKELIDKTWTPYQDLWLNYVGDSNVYYNEVMKPLIHDSLPQLFSRAKTFVSAKTDRLFATVARRLKKMSGHTPMGKWFFAFGSTATDLGGFGGGLMVLDLSHPVNTIDHIEQILPHELNHQIFDVLVPEDTTAKGLYRCINEGFAVYVDQLYYGDKYSLKDYLMYTQAGLDYCIKNDSVIVTKLKPFLFTSNRDHALALASRSDHIFKEGPGAIGYYLGYRICEEYVKRNGKNSWKKIYHLTPREIFAGSGL